MAAESLALTTDLAIGGMTCAACVRRVEKKLAKLDGVSASVNPATGRARVSHPPHIRRGELVAAVEQAGFTAALPEPLKPRRDDPDTTPPPQGERLLVTALFALPVLVLSMVPAWQFRNRRGSRSPRAASSPRTATAGTPPRSSASPTPAAATTGC